jgi:hypothetical protein
MFFFLMISDHPVLGNELMFIIDAEDALDTLLELLDVEEAVAFLLLQELGELLEGGLLHVQHRVGRSVPHHV